MLKTDLVELQRHQFIQRLWIGRLRIARRVENLLKILQRDFRLTINIDDVSQLLQRPEDEERINPQREKLPDRNLLPEDQIEHQEQNAGAERVDRRPLYKTEAAQVLHLLQFESENLFRDPVQPPDLLRRQSQALH